MDRLDELRSGMFPFRGIFGSEFNLPAVGALVSGQSIPTGSENPKGIFPGFIPDG
jgi:hypothetical protein